MTRENTTQWDLRLVEFELTQLKRERQHLDSKSFERPLTIWEQRRTREIAGEIGSLLRQLVGFRREANNRHAKRA